MNFIIKSKTRVCNGSIIRFTHNSECTKTIMVNSVYLPDMLNENDKLPCLFYLSGLTCTDENVMQKSGAFKKLFEHKIAFICPDTSPRGANCDPSEKSSWDFGEGAGFYVDAINEPWNNNYQMYSYITKELLNILESNFPSLDLKRCSITGHSMGGHGAIQIALKNTNLYKSVSAFAPICNPINCPWGKKAFTGYLGENNMKSWEEYDSCSLMKSCISNNHYDDILIDIGTGDSFLAQGQLLPEEFIKVCAEVNQKVTVRMQLEYDHSYYFISTFIDDHIDFHAKRLYNK